jgi:hypothetical protein
VSTSACDTRRNGHPPMRAISGQDSGPCLKPECGSGSGMAQ